MYMGNHLLSCTITIRPTSIDRRSKLLQSNLSWRIVKTIGRKLIIIQTSAAAMDKTIKILVVCFAALGIGLFSYHWISQWHNQELESAIEKERSACQRRMEKLRAEIAKLEQQLHQQATPASEPDLSSIFGTAAPKNVVEPTVDCRKTTRQVVAFFQYLDRKSYLIWPDINMRAEALFENIFKKLAAAPPTNVGEMDDIFTLVKNVTHFYRVLGKDRIDLLKEILKSEKQIIEPAMAVMFNWILYCNAGMPPDTADETLKTMYQYAGFFLNTLGGRSYLLRRDSKLRMLVSYYSLLVVDKANDAKMNAYGIDVRPYIDYLLYDISNQKGLLYHRVYLTRLNALREKYQ